jgi:predicted acylesterase/phospholipase RssA
VDVGLALGAGGARGCAHIGVIRGLEELGRRPMAIGGASMGALIGALYALGITPDGLASLRLGMRIRAAVRPGFSRSGLLNPAPIAALVRDLIGDKRFEDAKIPLAITAADLTTDERVVLREGPLAPAVIASMMIPTVFPWYSVGDRLLCDPGIIEGVPVDVPAQLGAQLVVAVSGDLPPADRHWWPEPLPVYRLMRGTGRVCEVVGAGTQWPWLRQFGCALTRVGRNAAESPAPCAVVWVQPAFGRMSANHFAVCERAIELGYQAMREAAPLLDAEVQRVERSVGASVSKPR